MHLLPEIIESAPEIQEIRRNIHAHPELRFEENRTADLVAEALSSGASAYSEEWAKRASSDGSMAT